MMGVLHWYFPEEIRCLVNLALSENWGGDFEEIKEVLLTSKETALAYLIIQDRFNEYDFYGNLLTEKINLLLSGHLKILKNKHSMKGIVFINRSEYKDKGSGYKYSNSPIYDYRKLLTVAQQIEREELKRQKVEQLLSEVNEFLRNQVS
jgi:hypothetical protein